MPKFVLLFCIYAAFFIGTDAELSLKNLLKHKTTTTEAPTTTTTAASHPPLFISHNVPTVAKECTVVFNCKKKLIVPDNPRPCLKYCVKNTKCGNDPIIRATANSQCVELNEELVRKEYEESQKDHILHHGRVALIDFPCQPGYLPDSRGRCREVW